MAYKVKPGFIGIALFDGDLIGGQQGGPNNDPYEGTFVRCTAFNVNLEQTPLWYDHTIGLRDSIPTSIHETKGDNGERQIQKHIWRASTKIIKGSITFPLTENNADVLFEKAKTGDDFKMSFQYTCGLQRNYVDCKINSYTLNLVAREMVTVTAEIWALDVTEVAGSTTHFIKEEKLITWDACTVDMDGGSVIDYMRSFDFIINNNLKAIYTAGSNISKALGPSKFRVGMQTVTGSAAIFDDALSLFAPMESTVGKEININVGNIFPVTLNVLYRPLQRSGNIPTLVHTLPFEGVWGEGTHGVD